MLDDVALVRTDISEEPSASIIRVTRISEPGITLGITSNQRMLQKILSEKGGTSIEYQIEDARRRWGVAISSMGL
jgi:hypothetical protein